MTDSEWALPQVPDSAFTEQAGVLRVASVVNDARLVWRPTSQQDVGIDGQIEHIDNEGRATGAIVFVQVKSGSSYFENKTEDGITFRPHPRHANYWERASSPVLLVLHNPRTEETLWINARTALRAGAQILELPYGNNFDAPGLRVAMGPMPDSPLSLNSVAEDMLMRRSDGFGASLDFLDLFAHGLVRAHRELYFGMDLVTNLIDTKVTQSDGVAFGFGSVEYDFLHDYVRYLATQDLARIDYDDFSRVWFADQLVGRFLVPLTARGTSLSHFLAHLEPTARHGIHAIQDQSFLGIPSFETYRKVSAVSALRGAVLGPFGEEG
jgi:hypothetical protein